MQGAGPEIKLRVITLQLQTQALEEAGGQLGQSPAEPVYLMNK